MFRRILAQRPLHCASSTASIDRTLRSMQQITAVGALLDGLEQLAGAGSVSDHTPFSWDLHREHAEKILGSRVVTLLDPVFSYPQWLAFPTTRLLAASGLLLGGFGAGGRAGLSAVLCATALAKSIRNRYGGDGSDHMSVITFSASALAEAFPGDTWVRQLCIRFVALQALISYATSGAVKAVSPIWRSGEAVSGVFRTRTYGDNDLFQLVTRYPMLRVALSWAVIVGELCFPLIALATPMMARAMLLAGVGFHLANGRFMGLNRFVWAFVGTYPAISHVTAGRRVTALGAAA